ncbi:MAG: membrane dipeptidase [Haloferacaceae archaeon]
MTVSASSSASPTSTAGFWDVAELSDDPLVVSHTAVHELSPSARSLTDEQLDAVRERAGSSG